MFKTVIPSIVCAGLLSLSAVASSQAADYVWIEGESSKKHNMKKHNWYASVIKKELSGGDYLSHFAGGANPTAEYTFTATAGKQRFWLRANPTAGPQMQYKLNGADWVDVNFRAATERVNIAKDGKPDMRYISWIDCGDVELKSSNTIIFKFTSKNNNHGAIDCFMFTTEDFAPSGQLKPGEKLGWADNGKWAFEPDADTFSSDAVVDLRSLNEKEAGADGYISYNSDGDFVDGKGQPIRFWAVNTYAQRKEDMAYLGQHARWLAKRGVNMVRLHGHLPPGKGSKITDVNKGTVKQAHMLVAAMKKEGIYTTISPYWGSHTKWEDSWKKDVKDNGVDSLTAIVFWDPDLQKYYKNWLKQLYAVKNPYTGIPLAKDPAVGIIQLQNEDSILFWTMQRVKGPQRALLRQQYYNWAKDKYGSVADAMKAWGGAKHKNDSGSELGLHSIWELTEFKGNKQRMADQMAFYGHTMYEFNKEMGRYLKEDLGCQQVVNAGNWKTGNQIRMLDTERYSYTANGVIGANKYYGSGHKGPKAGYKIMTDDWFNNKSATIAWRGLPTNVKQVKGHPFIIPESQWVPPNLYQAESAFLTAAYQSLTGVDAYYWFCTSDIGFGRPIGKWQISTAMQMGQFPAAALMFRKSYIAKGSPVVTERRALKNVFAMENPIIAEDTSFDPNRDTGMGNKLSNLSKGVDPAAFVIGPVEVVYQENEEKSDVTDLSQYIDEASGTITSVTGELALNHKQGWCSVNAPKAQGACGFLAKKGAFKLDDVTIDAKNEYAAIIAVSLDDKPLAKSKSILVQVGTDVRPYGFKAVPHTLKDKSGAHPGYKITALGSVPWNITKTNASITVKNSGLKKATVLNANLEPVKELSPKTGGAFELSLPEDALYIHLH